MLHWAILMGVYFSTYLKHEGWTFLLNKSVKERKKKKERRLSNSLSEYLQDEPTLPP